MTYPIMPDTRVVGRFLILREGMNWYLHTIYADGTVDPAPICACASAEHAMQVAAAETDSLNRAQARAA